MSADDDPELWLQQYGNALFSYALVRVNDHDSAEDVVQETFLAAVKNRATFDGRASRLTWLIGILKRKIIDHYRRAGKVDRNQMGLDDVPELPGVFDDRGGFKRTVGKWPADPAQNLQNEEFWNVFHQCRQALPANLQVAFNLREMDQFDTDSVCTELGISPSNLAVRIYRARLLLRQCLERKWFRDQA